MTSPNTSGDGPERRARLQYGWVPVAPRRWRQRPSEHATAVRSPSRRWWIGSLDGYGGGLALTFRRADRQRPIAARCAPLGRVTIGATDGTRRYNLLGQRRRARHRRREPDTRSLASAMPFQGIALSYRPGILHQRLARGTPPSVASAGCCIPLIVIPGAAMSAGLRRGLVQTESRRLGSPQRRCHRH